MTLFLIEFDRGTHTLVGPPRQFADADRETAFRERLQAQTLIVRDGLNRDIVLLEAESIEDLQHTHGSFFSSPQQLAERFGGTP